MKEKALKLADELDALHQYVPSEAPAMIRRLVEELDKQIHDNEELLRCLTAEQEHNEMLQTKPLSDEEILEILIDKGICGRLKDGSLCYWQADADLHDFARAIEERHGIK